MKDHVYVVNKIKINTELHFTLICSQYTHVNHAYHLNYPCPDVINFI